MNKQKMISYLFASGISLAALISGVTLVAPSESFRNETYLDPVGIVTSCAGHVDSKQKLGDVFTDEECLDKFAKDLLKADKDVDSAITVPLTVWQRAALISFTYNVGETAMRNSSLVKQFNQGNYDRGCDMLLAWVYSKGKKLKGLEVRREKERQMCLGNVDINDVLKD